MLALTGIPLYRDFAYYTLMNVNVLVVFLLTIKSHPIQTAEDVTSSVNSDKSHKMVNVFGDEIVQNPGQQEYFQMLKKEWS
uniref:Uncharacterized protein n=1 Tax=Panagrolaimus sp. JU765 TaxID=591449 RepID=A0AC34RJI1_9BILA